MLGFSLVPGRLRARVLQGYVLVSCLFSSAVVANAHDVVDAAAAANKRWDVPDGSAVATFLGTDEIEVAVLVLKKAAVLGTEITVQSDAPQVSFSSGESVKVTFTVKPGAEGAVSRFKLVGGDHPTISLDGKDDVRVRGKWIQAVKAEAKDLKVELTGATFASVTFGGKPDAPAAATAPAEAAEPATPKGPAGKAKKLPPQKLVAAADAFAAGVSKKCLRCSGEGKVTKSVKSGTYNDGAISRPKYRSVTERCDRCTGKGQVRAEDDVLNRLAGSFLVTLANLDEQDPKTQGTLSEAYKMITNSMIGDLKTWTLLTENGRSILSQRAPAAGTPVIAKALVKQSLPLKNGKRQYLVQIGGTDRMVLISDPVSADEVKSGPALVGGLLEPTDKEVGNEKPVAVLAQGFLVAPPINRGWYWWYWWEAKS